MTQTLTRTALIPAAGAGTRLGLGPKALLRLGDKSLLEILVQTLSPLVDQLVVAVPERFEHEFTAILKGKALMVPGGGTRQESIDNMLEVSTGEIILIQDAARPFTSRALCSAALEEAAIHRAAGAFIDPAVPVGLLEAGSIATYWDRHRARVFQAPQAFTREVLTAARQQTAGMQFQSTAQMVMQAGYALREVPGESENIKITTPLDWLIAQKVIAPLQGLIK